jgi:hypothetical protein
MCDQFPWLMVVKWYPFTIASHEPDSQLRDKSMPNSWSFNWVSMVTREGEGLEARFVESLLVFYVLCVFLYII